MVFGESSATCRDGSGYSTAMKSDDIGIALTYNHLVLLDVNAAGLSGRQAERALDAAGITVNRNGIPFDTRPPLDPSGIRIGTPALTTRGMGQGEMRDIGTWIAQVLEKPEDADVARDVERRVRELTGGFPLFSWDPVTAPGRAG